MNNFTDTLVSSSQINCSAVKESQMPLKQHPTQLYDTNHENDYFSLFLANLSAQHTWKGTFAKEGDCESTSRLLAVEQFELRALCA